MAATIRSRRRRVMDLSDPRFHTRRIQWRSIVEDGFSVEEVMLEAQRQGLHRLARSAFNRLENQKRSKGDTA